METALQAYLRSGKTPEDLKSEFGIDFVIHPTLPLVAYKYDMIESPRGSDIVKSARGTVLHRYTHELICQPFFRFFNHGEMLEETGKFDWNDFEVSTKEDGSLIPVFEFEGVWYSKTSGSFGEGL